MPQFDLPLEFAHLPVQFLSELHSEGLESHRRPDSPLDASVVLPHKIVGIFGLSKFDGRAAIGDQPPYGGGVGTALLLGHVVLPSRDTAVALPRGRCTPAAGIYAGEVCLGPLGAAGLTSWCRARLEIQGAGEMAACSIRMP